MKCKFCGSELFHAHQECRKDVIVDGNGNYVDDLYGLMGDSVYDSNPCYGPFTCVNCGAEYDCEGNFDEDNMECTQEPETLPGKYDYLGWVATFGPHRIEVNHPQLPYVLELIEYDSTKKLCVYRIYNKEEQEQYPFLTPTKDNTVSISIPTHQPEWNRPMDIGDAVNAHKWLATAIEAAASIEDYIAFLASNQ